MTIEIDLDFNNEIESIAKDIDDYSQTIYLILEICDNININKLASPAINFRDAINHYTKLYEACENKNAKEFICQKSSIEEHLSRGIKDTFIYIMSNIARKLSNIITIQSTLNNDQGKLREYFHIFKNMTLDIRLRSIKIERLDYEDIIFEQFKDNLKGLIDYLKSKNLHESFIKNLSYR